MGMAMEEVGKVADATKESAVAAQKAIDAGSGIGKFFDRVFGDLVIDAVGLMADRLKHFRIKNAISLQEKTEAILKEKGVEEYQPIAAKIALPLIENATLEDEDELQTLWAKLLANGLDGHSKIEKRFVSVLKELTSSEAKFFEKIMKVAANQPKSHCLEANYDIHSVQIDALTHFQQLGLITPAIQESKMGDGLSGPPIVSNWGLKKFYITNFGWSFAKALDLAPAPN